MKKSRVKGLVFNIQRFSIHDGPGIRTTVFFKGCPLRCIWCANPESINPLPEIMFNEARCTKCYECVSTCSSGAIAQLRSGAIIINRKKCNGCGECVDVCYNGALDICGRYMSPEEALSEVERDIPFYETSNGGMTASGGEPLMQHEFLIELFRGAHEEGIHTALETSGHASWKVLSKVLRRADLVLYDLKTVDLEMHKEMTGVTNELILKNVERISHEGVPTIVRIPVVPNYNVVTEEDIHRIVKFLVKLEGIERIDLLPYHRLGEIKYQLLGRKYGVKANPPKKEFMNKLREIIESYGYKTSIGGMLRQ